LPPHNSKNQTRKVVKTVLKEVFTVVQNEGYERPFWVKVGVAFENSDGSLNVRLNALPVNGTLHIRDKKSPEKEE